MTPVRKAATDKEMAAAPNALLAPRDALCDPYQKFPIDFGGSGELFECPQLTDSPHFFIRRGAVPVRVLVLVLVLVRTSGLFNKFSDPRQENRK